MSEGKPKQSIEAPQEDNTFVKLAEGGWDAVAADPEPNKHAQMSGREAEMAQSARDDAELENIKARLQEHASTSEKSQSEGNTPQQSQSVEQEPKDRKLEAAMNYLDVSDPNNIQEIEEKILGREHKNSETRGKIWLTGIGTGAVAFIAGASSFPLGFGTAAATTIGIETGAAIGLTVGGVIISGAGVAVAAGALGWAGKKGYDKFKEWRAIKQSEKYVEKTRGKGREVRYNRFSRRFEAI